MLSSTILTWNSEAYIEECLISLIEDTQTINQHPLTNGSRIRICNIGFTILVKSLLRDIKWNFWLSVKIKQRVKE